MGVHHPKCGKFAIQLDSDDVYKDEHTLSIIVRAFYEQQCGMVVGTYMMTDFEMKMLPPGIIDHREWTPENGRNNALRINGLGAPRAVYTPLLRQIKVPTTMPHCCAEKALTIMLNVCSSLYTSSLSSWMANLPHFG